MSGNISIQTEDNKTALKYDIKGRADNLEDCSYVSITFYDKDINGFNSAQMFFDKEFKNIVLITDLRKIYAVDNKFRNIVELVRGND